MNVRSLWIATTIAVFVSMSALVFCQAPPGCNGLPDHHKLSTVLQAVVKEGKQANRGMGNQRWAVVLHRDGIGCAVVFSSDIRSQEWPGSRMIAAQKANTANAVSGPDYACSTANPFLPAQPGQSASGFGHPVCKGGIPGTDIIKNLSKNFPTGPKTK